MSKPTPFPLTKNAIEKQQKLVDAIMETIDNFNDESPCSNMDVLGALEMSKFNYLAAHAEFPED